MTGEKNEPLTLTVVEAARALRISRSLAYEMVRQGTIPALRFGRVIRVPRHGLDALLSQNAAASPGKGEIETASSHDD